MATLGANILTLTDWAKRLDPDGKVPRIAELLSQTNEILEDKLWMEGNLPTDRDWETVTKAHSATAVRFG